MTTPRLAFFWFLMASILMRGDSFTRTSPRTTTTPYDTSVCGSTYTKPAGIVTSPNYPGSYPTNLDCYQTITVQSANSIQVTFVTLSVYYYNSYNCMYDYVELTGCDGSVTQYCYMNNNDPIIFSCSRSYTVTVLFHSGIYYNSYNTGFKLNYKANFGSNCSSVGGPAPLGGGGTILSPFYPSTYPISNDCYYIVQATASTNRIRVSFDQLSIYDPLPCENNYLKFYCLAQSSDAPLTLCNSSPRPPITFNCSSLEIWFHSRMQAPDDGITRNFLLSYHGVEGQPSATAAANWIFEHGRSIGWTGMLITIFVQVASKAAAQTLMSF